MSRNNATVTFLLFEPNRLPMFQSFSIRPRALALLLFAWAGLLTSYTVSIKFLKADSVLLELESKTIDFGNIGAGLEAVRVTHLTNRGSKPVVISEIKIGCGCTDVALERNHINPGETVPLRITMRSNGMRDQSVMIYLISNDTQSPVKSLRATANRETIDIVEPRIIDFGTVDRTAIKTSAQSFMLIFGNEENCKAADSAASLQVKSSEPFIKVDASRPCTRAGKPITVTIAEDAPIGDIDSFIQLTDSRRNLNIKLSVIGRVRGDFFALPQMVTFPGVTKNSGLTRQDIVVKQRVGTRHFGERMHIERVKISNRLKEFVVSKHVSTPTDDTASFSVLVDPNKFNGVWSSRVLKGNVRVICRCDGGHAEEIVVPIRVSLKGERMRVK